MPPNTIIMAPDGKNIKPIFKPYQTPITLSSSFITKYLNSFNYNRYSNLEVQSMENWNSAPQQNIRSDQEKRKKQNKKLATKSKKRMHEQKEYRVFSSFRSESHHRCLALSPSLYFCRHKFNQNQLTTTQYRNKDKRPMPRISTINK